MVAGLLCILLFFVMFHTRSISHYTPKKDETEEDLFPSKSYWETMAKWDNLGYGILSVFCLVSGIILIYNDLVTYFDWVRLF